MVNLRVILGEFAVNWNERLGGSGERGMVNFHDLINALLTFTPATIHVMINPNKGASLAKQRFDKKPHHLLPR